MSKIILDDVASGYNLGKINLNFSRIESVLNDKVLYRDNADHQSEPNQMEGSLDMNNQRILNLPKPINLNDVVRLQDVGSVLENLDDLTIPSVLESSVLSDGQLVVPFVEQSTTGAAFYINGTGIDSRLLTSDDYDLGAITETTMTLYESYPSGTTVTLAKNISRGSSATGSFTTTDAKTVTVVDGIITSII